LINCTLVWLKKVVRLLYKLGKILASGNFNLDSGRKSVSISS